MNGDEIEKALQSLLGASEGGQGLVITLRRHEEYEVLLGRIAALEEEKFRLSQDVSRMSSYAELYLRALDELNICVRRMHSAGLDTSWVSSIRGRRG